MKKERKILTAKEWEKRFFKEDKERKAHDKAVRRELPLDDLRSECIAIIHNEFGRDTAAYERVYNRGGATVQTLRRYANEKHWSPRLQTIQATLFAAGYELGPRRRGKK